MTLHSVQLKQAFCSIEAASSSALASIKAAPSSAYMLRALKVPRVLLLLLRRPLRRVEVDHFVRRLPSMLWYERVNAIVKLPLESFCTCRVLMRSCLFFNFFAIQFVGPNQLSIFQKRC